MAERETTFKLRGWLAAAVIFPAIIIAGLSEPLIGEQTWVGLGLNVAAWAVLTGGIFVRLWSILYIGGRKSNTIVTEGPYAACRHPLYIGTFLMVLSLALFLKSPLVLVAVVGVAVVYAAWIMPSEERHALACFGAAYEEYCARTPRLLPRLSRLGRPGIVDVKVAEFLREFARDFGCILLGAAAQLFLHLRAQEWWPKLFHLP